MFEASKFRGGAQFWTIRIQYYEEIGRFERLSCLDYGANTDSIDDVE